MRSRVFGGGGCWEIVVKERWRGVRVRRWRRRKDFMVVSRCGFGAMARL